MPLLGSLGEMLWGSQTKPDWSIQSPKRAKVWYVPWGSYLRGRPWEARRLIITRAIGEFYHQLTFNSVGCFLGHVLEGGANVSTRSLQAVWPHKMDAKTAILWSNLTKLSTYRGRWPRWQCWKTLSSPSPMAHQNYNYLQSKYRWVLPED